MGDLLGAMLVDRGPIRRFQSVAVVDVDFMLARSGFTLRELDRHACADHQIAKLAVDRLSLGRLQELVVLVVPAPES